MARFDFARCTSLMAGVLLSLPALAATKAEIKGSLMVGGVDAHLTHVRAAKVALDAKGTVGYEVVLSAKPAEGPLAAWKTADPRERGNFLHIVFTAKGEVWVYEIGHADAKNRPFGGVSEINKVSFDVQGDQLKAQIRTQGEQSFSDDRFTVDLTFETPVEAK
jgi:hypothetical protein